MPDSSITITPFVGLTLDALYAALAVRNVVFVVGQKITEVPDLDGLDRDCWHVLLYEEGRVVGTCRLLPLGDGKRIKMGRLAVLPACRGKGYAKAIFLAVHDWLDRDHRSAVMHAQQYLESFYASLGWRAVGEVFEEAGIAHIEMVRPAAEGRCE